MRERHSSAQIRPNQHPRDNHHHNGRREMDLKALAGRGSGHGSRSLPRGAAADEPFAEIPNGGKNGKSDGKIVPTLLIPHIKPRAQTPSVVVPDCFFVEELKRYRPSVTRPYVRPN